MKMSPAAKTYLISGYPRSMRDVVEYSEKVLRLFLNIANPIANLNSHLVRRYKSSTGSYSYLGGKLFCRDKLIMAPSWVMVSIALSMTSLVFSSSSCSPKSFFRWPKWNLTTSSKASCPSPIILIRAKCWLL